MVENNLANFSNEDIKNLIYTIREKQVMSDSDVAMLYNYETKKVNQAENIFWMYHLGASIKDLGKKCFAINRIEDIEIINKIVAEGK